MVDLLIKFGFLIWPFGHFLDLTIGDNRLPALDLIIFLIFTFSLPVFIRNFSSIKKDRLFWPLAYFFLAAALSLFVRLPELGILALTKPAYYLIRLISYLSLYYTFKFFPLKKYSQYIFVSILVFTLSGLLQYVISPNMSFIKFIGLDDHYYRLIGTFLDPNFTGAVLGSLAIFLLSSGLIYPGLFLLIPLGLTFSRASYLSFLIPLFIYALLRKKYLILAIPFILGVIILLSPKPFGEGVNLLRTFSIYSRVGSITQGLELFTQRPLTGWGYNTLITDTGRVGIDNSFAYILATTGIIGFAAFLNLLLRIFEKRPLTFKLALLSIILHSLFNNTFFYPWILAFVVVLMIKD